MTKQKHACPINVVKQNQGTGKKVLDRTDEKPTGSKQDGAKERDTRIYTSLQYASTVGLHNHFKERDIEEQNAFCSTLNDAHRDIAAMILDGLNEMGIPFASLDGEILQMTIRFTKNIPEAQ